MSVMMMNESLVHGVGAVALLGQLISVASPNWTQFEGGSNMGLRSMCSTVGEHSVCKDNAEVGDAKKHVMAAQAFAIISVVLSILGALAVYAPRLKFAPSSVSLPGLPHVSVFAISALCGLIANTIWAVHVSKDHAQMGGKLGWAYWVSLVSNLALLVYSGGLAKLLGLVGVGGSSSFVY